MILELALVAALVIQHVRHRRERDELRAIAEVADELPDDDEPMVLVAVCSARDEAIAIATLDTEDGGFVVVHERQHGADCTCTRPEVHRIKRGRA